MSTGRGASACFISNSNRPNRPNTRLVHPKIPRDCPNNHIPLTPIRYELCPAVPGRNRSTEQLLLLAIVQALRGTMLLAPELDILATRGGKLTLWLELRTFAV